MREVYLRGHPNILKRLLVHVAGLNLGLLLRQVIGVGTPPGPAGPGRSRRLGADRAVCRPPERSGTAPDTIPARFGADHRAVAPPTPSTGHLNTEDFYLGLLVLLQSLPVGE